VPRRVDVEKIDGLGGVELAEVADDALEVHRIVEHQTCEGAVIEAHGGRRRAAEPLRELLFSSCAADVAPRSANVLAQLVPLICC
jgi:hypothetical protein